MEQWSLAAPPSLTTSLQYSSTPPLRLCLITDTLITDYFRKRTPGEQMTDPRWLEYNRRGCAKQVDVHLEAQPYDLVPLRCGRRELTPLQYAQLGPVDGPPRLP